MAGFSGRITFEGDKTTADELVSTAIKFANKLIAWKETHGLENIIRHCDLGDGRFAIVGLLEHINSIHIVAPPTDNMSDYEGLLPAEPKDGPGVVDVISGVVPGYSIIDEDVELSDGKGGYTTQTLPAVRTFIATQRCMTRFSNVFQRARLGVDEYAIFSSLSALPNVRYSQYAHVKPSCYSGAMRRFVQLLFGVGNILRPTWEEQWMAQNQKSYLFDELTTEDGNIISYPKSAFGLYSPTNNQQIQQIQLRYDYRFYRTHGITFDSDGTPWLIEISNRGVHAYPVYMDPISLTREGKERYLEVSPELDIIFDEFGGFPAFIPFPVGEAFQAFKRAGELVELISSGDMGVFYSKSAYSSAMGWCFNQKGTEAHNTCYGYNDQGIGVGYHYAVAISIDRDELPDWTDETSALVDVLNLTQLYEVKKARRMDPGIAQGFVDQAENGDLEGAKQAFDDAEVVPSLSASATIRMVKSGQLYHPARFKFQPQIKFPEPIYNGLISHDFGRLAGYPRPSNVKCNMTMFACFIDNAIETVSYFYNPTPGKPSEAENTRQECQYIGSWTYTYGSGATYAAGNFYSSRFDFRETITSQKVVTTYTGNKVGEYNTYAAVAFFSICIDATRTSVFHITHHSRDEEDRYLNVSVAIPMHDRCGYYMARKSGWTNVTESEGGHNEEAGHAPVHHYKLYNFVFHWVGYCSMDLPGGSKCIAKKVGESTRPACFDGPPPDPMQYSVCGGNYAGIPIVIQAPWNAVLGSVNWPPLTPPTSYSKTISEGAEQEFAIYFINDSGHGVIKTKSASAKGGDPLDLPMSGWWWVASPDDSGVYTYIADVHSCLGKNVMNYMDDLDGNTAHKGSPTELRSHYGACYVGVID